MDRRGEPDQYDFANPREQYPVQAVQRMREGISADEDDEPGGEAVWLVMENGQRTHPQRQCVDQPRAQAVTALRDRQDGSLEWISRSSRELVAAAGGRVQARRGRLLPPGATKACAACQANHARRWSSIRCKKYSPFVLMQISSFLAPSHPIRGAARDRHERAVGCGGRESCD